eukprot:tig00020816_g14143.t1
MRPIAQLQAAAGLQGVAECETETERGSGRVFWARVKWRGIWVLSGDAGQRPSFVTLFSANQIWVALVRRISTDEGRGDPKLHISWLWNPYNVPNYESALDRSAFGRRLKALPLPEHERDQEVFLGAIQDARKGRLSEYQDALPLACVNHLAAVCSEGAYEDVKAGRRELAEGIYEENLFVCRACFVTGPSGPAGAEVVERFEPLPGAPLSNHVDDHVSGPKPKLTRRIRGEEALPPPSPAPRPRPQPSSSSSEGDEGYGPSDEEAARRVAEAVEGAGPLVAAFVRGLRERSLASAPGLSGRELARRLDAGVARLQSAAREAGGESVLGACAALRAFLSLLLSGALPSRGLLLLSRGAPGDPPPPLPLPARGRSAAKLELLVGTFLEVLGPDLGGGAGAGPGPGPGRRGGPPSAAGHWARTPPSSSPARPPAPERAPSAAPKASISPLATRIQIQTPARRRRRRPADHFEPAA